MNKQMNKENLVSNMDITLVPIKYSMARTYLLIAYTGRLLFYCTSLYCALQMLCFLQIEGLWQPYIKQFHQHHFPTYLLTSCLSVTLVILMILQFFSLLLYLLWLSVIRDLCCYYCKKIATH